ncbi:MAG TPA: metallophosphoesterase [Planctomycetota bacterium]|nr:metallophosphoesterase [Planctomycetota bacterium]
MASQRPPGRLRAMPAILFAGLFSALIVAGATCQGVATDVRFDASPLPAGVPNPLRFVICGDTRVSLEPWRSSTRVERERVAAKVVELRPAFVLNSGDLVGAGGNYRMWQVFDRLTEGIRQAGIRYVPALGNHEYYGKNEHAMKMYFERFPDLKGRKWYSYDAGPARLLILDSNFDEFEGDEAARQSAWLQEALELAQGDAAVRFVLLVCHHPPYTNSGHDPSRDALDRFVKPALRFPKYRGMINGHVHTYERFEVEGRSYVVSGGGGAPLYSVEIDPAKWRRAPAYLGPADRGHHVVECSISAEAIRCEVHTLAEDGSWSITDKFEIR